MRFTLIAKSLCVAALLASTPLSALAQSAEQEDVILIADSVFLQGNNTLTARGNVEAVQGDTRLTATAIVYDSVKDQITIEGPIKIRDGEAVEIFADFAELDTSMQNGLLTSARLVLNEQVTIDAAQARREEGKRTKLDKVAATSCLTCLNGAPLWQIRAKRVTHDQEKQQLFFDNAQFRIMDVPVFYLPRLRLPDPTLERATGFLIPQVRSRSRFGLGVKVPYFIRLGDHKDLTLIPYLSPNTRTLEWRYRQAFTKGEIEFLGAFSKDDFSGFDSRAYLFGTGTFEMPRDYTLSFDIKSTSDNAYLVDYDYSNLDRLNSEVALARTNRLENTKLALSFFESLRASEDNNTLPSVVVSARTEQRLFPRALGGELFWQLEAHSHYRRSDLSSDSGDLDDIVDGRDVSRVNAELEWRRTWLTNVGLEFGTTASLALDAVHTAQDATLADDNYAQITPTVAAHLRYPLIKTTATGVTHIVEPIGQIAWSGGDIRAGTSPIIANDESTRVEFDEGNLLSLSRFPSDDRRERGLVGAWGMNWSRLGPKWETHLTVGQVIRQDVHDDFTLSSGLAGTESDFLVATQLKSQSGIDLTLRTLIDGVNGLNKAEARGAWNNDRLDLGASYVWLGADADEDRASVLSEWNLDSSYRLNRHWTGLANWRYDVASDTTAEAGIGLEYRNECVNARFSVSRRFTSSTTVRPATDLSFTVQILGFSAATTDKSYARTCSKTAG